MSKINSSEQPNQLQEHRRRRSKRQRIALMAMAVLVVLTVIFTIWALIFIMARRHETTRLAFITNKKVEEGIPCSVALIDHYVDLRAPGAGFLVPLVEEGARVAKGDRIAIIVPSNLEGDVERFFLANEAYHARRIVLAGLSNAVKDVLPKTRSDSIMREAILSLSRAPTLGDLSELQCAMQQLDRALDTYRGESLHQGGQDTELMERRRERNRILEKLEASVISDGILTAPTPGTIHFSFLLSEDTRDENGRLEIADPKTNIANPKAEIERLANLPLQLVNSRQGLVTADMPVVRIANIESSTMVVVVANDLCPADDESALKRGKIVNLVLSPESRIDRCRISRIVLGDEYDRIFLTPPSAMEFSTDLTPFTDAMMSIKVPTGPAVPVRSLFDLSSDMKKAKLKTVQRGMTKTVSVDIEACDGTYAIVKSIGDERPLKEADLYVVNPWTIGDGQLID